MFVFNKIFCAFTFVLSLFHAAWGMENIHHDHESVDAVYNLKNTYSAVSDEHKQLSLLNGALADYAIRRLYDFGEIKPVWGKDNRDRSIIIGYENGGHALMRLIHAFFYRVPGSTSITDFGETKQLVKDLSDNDLMTLIADVLVSCVHARTALAIIHQELPAFTALDVQNQFFMLRDNNVRESAIKNEVWRRIGNENDQNEFRHIRDEVRNTIKGAIEKLWQNVLLSTKKIEEILNPVARKSLNNFGKHDQRGEIFLRSLLESNPENIQSLYLPHMTETILLAFVYKKCGKEKEKISYFYTTLHEKLNQKLLKKPFISESYQEMSSEAAVKRLNEIFEQEDLTQYGEEMLFCSTQRHSYPQPNNYKKICGYEIGGLIAAVHDCMENALRNLMRSMAYDRKLNRFTVALLQRKRRAEIHESLKKYINIYNDPKLDCSDNAHLEWLKLVSNVPYLLYCRTVCDKKSVSANNNRLYAYLMLPQEEKIDEKWLAINKIQVINEHGFELQPCLRNIILLFNHLLQLGLFDDKKMTEEIVRPDFIKIYFPVLCEKIGCKGYLSTCKEAQAHEEDKDFDSIDFVDKIYATFTFPGFSCCFKTYPGHGELNITEGNKGGMVFIPQKVNYQECPSLSLFVTHLKNHMEALKFLLPQHLYSNLFALALEDNNQTGDLFDELDQLSLVDSIMKEIVKLRLRLIAQEPDEDLRMDRILFLFDWVVNAELKGFYGEFTQVAYAAVMKTQNYIIHSSGLKLFKILCEKNYKPAFIQVVRAVTQLLLYGEWWVSTNEELFDEFFELGCGFVEVVKVVAKAAAEKFQDKNEPWRAARLFEKLLAKNCGFTEVIQAAAQALQRKDSQQFAIELFEKLFEKGYGFDEAIKIAREAIKSDNPDIWSSGLMLFQLLVKQGKILDEEALNAAIEAVKSENEDVQSSGACVFVELFEHGKAFDEGSKVALEVLKSENESIRWCGLMLLSFLVEHGKNLEEAIGVAREAAKSDDLQIKSLGLQLFQALCEKGKALEESVDIAREAVMSDEECIKESGFMLLAVLFEKDKILEEELIKVMEEAFLNEKLQFSFLHLFEKLVEKGHCFAQAVHAAVQFFFLSDGAWYSINEQLFDKLFERGYGFAEAAEAAREKFLKQGHRGKAEMLFKKLFAKGHGFIEAEQAIRLVRESDHAWGADSLEEALKKAQEEKPEEENN